MSTSIMPDVNGFVSAYMRHNSAELAEMAMANEHAVVFHDYDQSEARRRKDADDENESIKLKRQALVNEMRQLVREAESMDPEGLAKVARLKETRFRQMFNHIDEGIHEDAKRQVHEARVENDARLGELNHENDNVRARVDELIDEIDSLKTKASNTRDLGEEITRLEKAVDSHNQTVLSLNDKHKKALATSAKNYDNRLARRDDTISELQNRNTAVDKKLADSERSVSGLQAECTEQKLQFDRLQANTARYKEDTASYKDKFRDLLDSANRDINELAAVKSRNDDLTAKLQKMNDRQNINAEERRCLTGELEASREQNQSMADQNGLSDQKIKELEAAAVEIKMTITEAAQKNAAWD